MGLQVLKGKKIKILWLSKRKLKRQVLLFNEIFNIHKIGCFLIYYFF